MAAFILPNSGGGTPIPCIFRSTTGMLCPFCGMTRGLIALGHLDFTSALAYNPGSPLILAFFIWGALAGVRGMLGGRLGEVAMPSIYLRTTWYLLMMAVFGSLWYVRILIPLF